MVDSVAGLSTLEVDALRRWTFHAVCNAEAAHLGGNWSAISPETTPLTQCGVQLVSEDCPAAWMKLPQHPALSSLLQVTFEDFGTEVGDQVRKDRVETLV